MADVPERQVLEYGQDPRSRGQRWRRVFYCIGLPLLAFGMSNGLAFEGSGLIAATGAFLVALVLPVRD